MKILVSMNKQEAYVTVDGKIVKTFNRFSEDYALALAEKYASKLRIQTDLELKKENNN